MFEFSTTYCFVNRSLKKTGNEVAAPICFFPVNVFLYGFHRWYVFKSLEIPNNINSKITFHFWIGRWSTTSMLPASVLFGQAYPCPMCSVWFHANIKQFHTQLPIRNAYYWLHIIVNSQPPLVLMHFILIFENSSK